MKKFSNFLVESVKILCIIFYLSIFQVNMSAKLTFLFILIKQIPQNMTKFLMTTKIVIKSLMIVPIETNLISMITLTIFLMDIKWGRLIIIAIINKSMIILIIMME